MRIYFPNGTMEYRKPNGEPDLKTLQDIVEGPIEVVYCYSEDGRPAHMIVNEEGRIVGKKFNPIGTIIYGVMCVRNGFKYEDWNVIAGTVVLLEGEELLT